MIVGPAAVKHCGMLGSHSGVFRNVADTSRAVISSRALNPLSEGLIQEGHASKGFAIKAKSCDWGPMAGLVLANPGFSKSSILKHTQDVADALHKGAGKTDVHISSQRLLQLTELGVIRQNKPDGINSKEIEITSTPTNGLSGDFVAVRRGDVEPIWQLFHLTGNVRTPVEGLTNKQVPSAGKQPSGPRAAVAGDYDLFGVWGRHENRRPLQCAPRLMQGAKDWQPAKAYVAAVRGSGAENPNMGNVSFYVEMIIQRLNSGIITGTQYSGGNMVHHNDESGNPFTPGEDYPILFFIPGQEPRAACNAHELLVTYLECEELGYIVERNPAFCLKRPEVSRRSAAPVPQYR